MLLDLKDVSMRFGDANVADGASRMSDSIGVIDGASGANVADNKNGAIGMAGGASGANNVTGSANVETVEHKTSESAEQMFVFQNVNLTVERGESVAVVAPSGAGKSTLLSIAGLLLQPSKGSVFVDGENMTDATDDVRSAMRAGTIGLLFQHTQLIGSLRAIENVMLPADFAQPKQRDDASDSSFQISSSNGTYADVETRAEQMLEAFGLTDKMYHYPYQLSVGQKRRIATARALILNPALIIADEPTNDLDPKNAKIVVDALFKRVGEGSAGMLVATHDAELAKRADRTFELASRADRTFELK